MNICKIYACQRKRVYDIHEMESSKLSLLHKDRRYEYIGVRDKLWNISGTK